MCICYPYEVCLLEVTLSLLEWIHLFSGIFICNVDCSYTAEWKSSRLIHARTGVGFGIGDIIVFTNSGGMGTCLVKFRGYMPRVGLLTEAAVWVDESKLFEEKQTTTVLSNRRAFSPNSTYTDPLGVAPEETGY